jgi:hypothetical protein
MTDDPDRRDPTEDDAALDRRLRELLPAPPLPHALAARVHARARAELAGPRRAPRAAGVFAAAAVASAVVVYLAWAVEFLSALARG